jgi:alanine racemase
MVDAALADGGRKRGRGPAPGATTPAPFTLDGPEAAAMAQGHSRPAWAEIDLSAIRHNARVLATLVRPAALCAVVKAHGYGHGGPAVAQAALAGGATSLAVAMVDEGVELRRHGLTGPILLLSECGPDAAATALANELTPTLYSVEGIEQFAQVAEAQERETPVHVKVDTGMHRVGAPVAEVPALLRAIAGHPLLRLEGLWTHLPVADGESADDHAFTRGQLEAFDQVAAQLEGAAGHPTLRHAANTAGAIVFASARYDMVRCGIGLYGYLPGPTVTAAFTAAAGGATLRPALSLRARVTSTRLLDEGERPSYGRLRALSRRSVVATVPIGYADGVPRALFTQGFNVLLGGRRRPLAGMVTMDQIMVDCGDDTSVRPGDEVVLLGRQGHEEITADEWARLLGTISYEVLCGIGPRVPRVVVNGPGSTDPDLMTMTPTPAPTPTPTPTD